MWPLAFSGSTKTRINSASPTISNSLSPASYFCSIMVLLMSFLIVCLSTYRISECRWEDLGTTPHMPSGLTVWGTLSNPWCICKLLHTSAIHINATCLYCVVYVIIWVFITKHERVMLISHSCNAPWLMSWIFFIYIFPISWGLSPSDLPFQLEEKNSANIELNLTIIQCLNLSLIPCIKVRWARIEEKNHNPI